MSFKMNKLSAAVAATLGVAVVGMSPAQADEILFPYIVTSGTVTTLVSAINYADIGAVYFSANQLHYRYWYKNGTNAENNTATCAEVDRAYPSSANDIVTFDVSEQFAGNNLGILFEDTKVSTLPFGNNSGYGNASFALLKGLTTPVRAFLVVDNNDAANGVAASTAASVAGEAIILEFQNGAAWGYQAYNPSSRGASWARTNPYDFSDYVETAGEVIAGENAQGVTPVALAPFTATGGEFRTKFFVTPIAPSVWDATAGAWIAPGQAGPAVGTLPSQLQGNLNARVRLAIQDWALGNAAIYDRDETPISGQVPQNVACVGGVDATAMLTEGALLQVPDGGWSNLVVSAGTLNAQLISPVYAPTPEAIVIKLEYNETAPLKLDDDKDSPTVKGITNNAVWLRKGIKESVPPVAGVARLQLSSIYEPDAITGVSKLTEENLVGSSSD